MFDKYKRTDLIKILRANKQHLPADVLKHSRDELLNILNNATDLDLTCTKDFVLIGEKKKDKKVKQEPKQEVKQESKQVVLNELSDDDMEEVKKPEQQPTKPYRTLSRKKLNVPEPTPPVKNVVQSTPPVKQALVDTKEQEAHVRNILKDYTVEVRNLLLNFDDGNAIDLYDEQNIVFEYNHIRNDAENAIDNIIKGLKTDFNEKFYDTVSKILDQSLEKVQKFLGLN